MLVSFIREIFFDFLADLGDFDVKLAFFLSQRLSVHYPGQLLDLADHLLPEGRDVFTEARFFVFWFHVFARKAIF
jgi:hypothetical protein